MKGDQYLYFFWVVCTGIVSALVNDNFRPSVDTVLLMAVIYGFVLVLAKMDNRHD